MSNDILNLFNYNMKTLILIFASLFSFSSGLIAQSPYSVQNINKSEPKPEEISVESKFTDENFQYIPMNKWKEGMKFLVLFREEYDKGRGIDGMFPYTKSTKFSLNYISKEEFKWKIFTFKYSEYRKNGLLYLVFNCEGKMFVYNSLRPESYFRDGHDVFMRDLVYVDEIDKAKELLLGKTLYIMSDSWYNDNLSKGGSPSSEKSKQFVPVVIKSIGVNELTSTTQPIKVIFETENGNEFYVAIKFTNTNNLHCGKREWYNIERENKAIFYNVFSFSDPHLKYPHINSEVWQKIQEGNVAVGMTEEECTLSWGKPKEINRSSYGSDQWVYSGQYLYFDDGKLTAFN